MQRWVIILVIFFCPLLFAQEQKEDFDAILKESLDNMESQDAQVTQEREKKTGVKETPENLPKELSDLSSLGSLAPFEDVAVIQRRYLPKTKRFEIFPNVGGVMNDAFFTNAVLSGRINYSIIEQIAFEFIFNYYNTSNREVTNNLLKAPHSVTTKSFIFPKQYFGLDFKWSPLYGKFSFGNKKIIPFDMYFSLGGGSTSTSQGTSPFTLHLGGGQIFAISKSLAFRWDLSWYMYQSTTTVSNSTQSLSFTNLVGTVGLSFFFPKASYR